MTPRMVSSCAVPGLPNARGERPAAQGRPALPCCWAGPGRRTRLRVYAKSEHSQMTISAISSGAPNRPIGSWAMICRATFGSRFIQRSTGGVRTQPGHTALMRTPRETYSSAADLVNPMTPCFAAEYADQTGNGEARTPASPPRSRMARTTSSALLLRRLAMATRVPSLAKANAVALPTPELPPVTRATLFFIEVRALSCPPPNYYSTDRPSTPHHAATVGSF